MDKGSIRLQVLAAVSATFAFLTVGTFLGWSSPTHPILTREDSPIPVSSEQWSWVISFANFGMVFGPMPASYFAALLGRKVVLISTSVPFVASWLLVTLAKSVHVLYIARFIAGLGQGIAFSVAALYLAEISENRIRGAMGTLFQVMMNLGTLFEYCVGPFVSFTALALISMVFPFVFLITFVWMPESPYFLLANGKEKEAQETLMRLRGRKNFANVKEEFEAIQETLDIEKREKGSVLDLVRYEGNRKAFFIVVGLLWAQNFSGIIAILSYTATIFTNSGSGIDANMSAIVVGIVTLLASIVSSLLVDRAGRKPLLLFSNLGCSACMLGLGVYFFYAPVIDHSMNIDWIPLALVIIYIIAYMFGLGPLPWAVAGEILPNSVKGHATAIVSMLSAILSLIVVKMFQELSDNVGNHVVFWVFAACCFCAAIGVHLFLPETKGKSLLDIYKELTKTTTRFVDNSSVSTISTCCPSDVNVVIVNCDNLKSEKQPSV